jgi:hypothetical protein
LGLVVRRRWELQRAVPDGLRRVEQLLQKWSAPPAARAGSETVGELTGTKRTLHTQEVQHFAFADVETDTQIIV